MPSKPPLILERMSQYKSATYFRRTPTVCDRTCLKSVPDYLDKFIVHKWQIKKNNNNNNNNMDSNLSLVVPGVQGQSVSG